MIGIMSAACLDIHAAYLCRHAGACCTAGWPIPVEEPALSRIALHFGRGDLAQHESAGADEQRILVRSRANGACAFYDGRHRNCRVHGELGVQSLPTACRHFPRIVLQDARGTFLTLSHFCPTAADLLFADRPAAIVRAPDTLIPPGTLEGLDARAALPPNLTARVLMDLDAFSVWERLAVSTLGSGGETVADAIELLAGATRAVLSWVPRSGTTLRSRVEDAFVAPRARKVRQGRDDASWIALARASVQEGLTPPASFPTHARARLPHASGLIDDEQRAVRNYLAARLFASWTPYFATSLATVVDTLRVTLAVLRSEVARRLSDSGDPRTVVRDAIRQTDLLFAHLSDTRSLVHLMEHRS